MPDHANDAKKTGELAAPGGGLHGVGPARPGHQPSPLQAAQGRPAAAVYVDRDVMPQFWEKINQDPELKEYFPAPCAISNTVFKNKGKMRCSGIQFLAKLITFLLHGGWEHLRKGCDYQAFCHTLPQEVKEDYDSDDDADVTPMSSSVTRRLMPRTLRATPWTMRLQS